MSQQTTSQAQDGSQIIYADSGGSELQQQQIVTSSAINSALLAAQHQQQQQAPGHETIASSPIQQQQLISSQQPHSVEQQQQQMIASGGQQLAKVLSSVNLASGDQMRSSQELLNLINNSQNKQQQPIDQQQLSLQSTQVSSRSNKSNDNDDHQQHKSAGARKKSSSHEIGPSDVTSIKDDSSKNELINNQINIDHEQNQASTTRDLEKSVPQETTATSVNNLKNSNNNNNTIDTSDSDAFHDCDLQTPVLVSPKARLNELKRLLHHTESLNELPKFGVETSKEKELGELIDQIDVWGLNIFEVHQMSEEHSLTVVMFKIFKVSCIS